MTKEPQPTQRLKRHSCLEKQIQTPSKTHCKRKTDHKLKTARWNTPSSGGIAIVSDIHANIDALGAVLTDIAAQRCFSIFCLGDTIGYGPEPVACIKHMREFAAVNLMGNHEGMFIVSRGDCRKLAVKFQKVVHAREG